MNNRIVTSFKRSDVPLEILVGPSIPKLYLYTLIDWAIYIGSAFLMFKTPYYLCPLWIIIMAGRLHAFGVIIHDLSHMKLIKKKFSIRVIEILVGYPIGTTINAMAYHHLRHHRNTLFNNDPYYNINKKCTGIQRLFLAFKKGLFFVPFWIIRSIVGIFATFIPAVRTPYARIFLQDVSKLDLSRHKEVIVCAREDIFLAIFHLCLFALTFQYPFLLFSYYAVIPVAGVFCIYRLLIEHEYDIVADRSVYTMIECTFDHHTSAWERILVGPRNIGYHCMHHIHPGVGLHQLPKLRDWYLENSSYYQERYKTKKKWNWKADLFGSLNDLENKMGKDL
ncbi:MAG: fatty acid desaturase family protein [Bacteriovoracaceae bacterium]